MVKVPYECCNCGYSMVHKRCWNYPRNVVTGRIPLFDAGKKPDELQVKNQVRTRNRIFRREKKNREFPTNYIS